MKHHFKVAELNDSRFSVSGMPHCSPNQKVPFWIEYSMMYNPSQLEKLDRRLLTWHPGIIDLELNHFTTWLCSFNIKKNTHKRQAFQLSFCFMSCDPRVLNCLRFVNSYTNGLKSQKTEQIWVLSMPNQAYLKVFHTGTKRDREDGLDHEMVDAESSEAPASKTARPDSQSEPSNLESNQSLSHTSFQPGDCIVYVGILSIQLKPSDLRIPDNLRRIN